MIGNKIDVDQNEHKVEKDLVGQYCDDKGLEHFYVSAKTGEGVV